MNTFDGHQSPALVLVTGLRRPRATGSDLVGPHFTETHNPGGHGQLVTQPEGIVKLTFDTADDAFLETGKFLQRGGVLAGMINALTPLWRSERSRVATVTKKEARSRFEIQVLTP